MQNFAWELKSCKEITFTSARFFRLLCGFPIRYIAEAMLLIGNITNHSGIIHAFCQVNFLTAPKEKSWKLMKYSCNAADFGFPPDADAMDNVRALQQAVDQGGSIIVSQPGTYKICGTVYVDRNTTLKSERSLDSVRI